MSGHSSKVRVLEAIVLVDGRQNLHDHEAVCEAIPRADVALARKPMAGHFEFVERNPPAL
jgi:DNA-binding GntR family transcriptional regulator